MIKEQNSPQFIDDERPEQGLSQQKMLVGWREWIALPDLGICAMKAKVDTGARTSAIHATEIREYRKNGEKWVKFLLHPSVIQCGSSQERTAKVVDRRMVRDSGGHESFRYFIETRMIIGGQIYPIEITLASREKMKFKMLIGRTAMNDRLIVDPLASFLATALKDLTQ